MDTLEPRRLSYEQDLERAFSIETEQVSLLEILPAKLARIVAAFAVTLKLRPDTSRI